MHRPFVVRSSTNTEVVFAAINPRQGIAGTVELREVELVVCREEVALL
jgi:hypothetical protein